MRPADLFDILIRSFGVSMAFGGIILILTPPIGPFAPLLVGIFLMLFAGLITRGFYGRGE